MSRWFRHYAGMMRDDKLVRVAIRSKQTIERVAWIWGAILESAAEIDDNGRFDVDAEEIAYFLRADEDDIHAAIAGLESAGRIADGCVVKWCDRQFQSDKSATRQAAYRERKRAEKLGSDDNETSCNDGVTSLSRHRDAPETETELETEEEAPLPPLRGARDRGSKIPEDWVPPVAADVTPEAKALASQWSAAAYAAEAEAFRNYWLGESGAKARKSDWNRAWANRIVAVHSKVMRDAKFGNGPAAKPMSAAATTDAEREINRQLAALRADYDADRITPREHDAERARLRALLPGKQAPPAQRAKHPQSIGDLVARATLMTGQAA